MKFPTTLKQLIDGRWQARSLTSLLGEVAVVGATPQDAEERLRNELRYRLEYCP